MATEGYCLCKTVRFELDFKIEATSNCHCQFCRRAHGAAFVTTALVPTSALRITAGEESIARHQGRYFCRTCGSRLFNRGDSYPDATSLVVTSLAQDPTVRPAAHMREPARSVFDRLDLALELRDGGEFLVEQLVATLDVELSELSASFAQVLRRSAYLTRPVVLRQQSLERRQRRVRFVDQRRVRAIRREARVGARTSTARRVAARLRVFMTSSEFG